MNTQENLKAKTIDGLIWKFSERILAQLVSLVVSIILARLLVPEDYSAVSVVTIFFNFANVIISGGLNTALIQKKDSDIEDYSSVFFVSILISIVLYIILFICAPFIAQLYDLSILIPIIRVMGIALIINAVKSILCAYISNKMEFRKFFLSTIIGTVISAFVGIYMAYKGFGPWALVAQQLTNCIIDTVILFFSTRFKLVLAISLKKLKVLFSFGWKIFINSIINELYNESLPLIIGVKYSSVDLAYYTKGRSFPKLFNSSIGDTIQAVLFPAMSKVQDDKEKLLYFTRTFMQVSSLIIFPMMVGFLVISDNFVNVVLTEKWMPAAIYIKIFCIAYMFEIIQTGNIQTIKALGRSDITLILSIIKKSLYFLVIIIALFFTNSPIYIALASVINMLIATVINTFPNRKLIGYTYRKQISDVLVNLVLSLIMGTCVYFVDYLPFNKFAILILQIVFGILSYFILNLLVKNKSYITMKKMIKEYFKR